ncbi:helix-turn-helix domain-containing protein [Actinoplanes sp. G11-F43]|uniref:helix-turn-helix domain-containing protein n=1 Tax=Actinoplanes sp. G11-F43 TaxID=3424130 RepID=UPI003D34CFD5
MDDELTPAQSDALLGRETADHAILTALLHDRIGRWPWWDRAWRIVGIHEVRPRQINDWLHEVTVEGTAGRDVAETLPVSVFLRVAGQRIDRFEVRAGEALIGPPIRHGDPHPFGSILSALMDRRGISPAELARRCGLAMTTVRKLRAGHMVPRDPRRAADLAAALGMPAGDLMAIVGMPEPAEGEPGPADRT